MSLLHLRVCLQSIHAVLPLTHLNHGPSVRFFLLTIFCFKLDSESTIFPLLLNPLNRCACILLTSSINCFLLWRSNDEKNAVSENLGSFGSFGEKNIALALIRIRAGIGQCLE